MNRKTFFGFLDFLTEIGVMREKSAFLGNKRLLWECYKEAQEKGIKNE